MTAVDLMDPSLFRERREHEVFRSLRDAAPVYRHPEKDGPGFYAVTRHADVAEVLRSPKRFRNAPGIRGGDPPDAARGSANIHGLDGARHAKLRAAAMPGVRGETLAAIAPEIRTIVRDLIDACPRGEPFDFVSKVAAVLPMLAIGGLLGVPAEDRGLLVRWGNAMTDALVGAPEQEGARDELSRYFRGLVAAKRAAPGEDLATVLSQANVDEAPLSDEALEAYFLLLTVAGNETTRFLLTGGLEQLCLQPDDFQSLRDAPHAIPAAVEEMVRWVSPVMRMRRVVAEEVELAGAPLRPGDKVAVYYVSANRDERCFEAPERFLPKRASNPHLGFGLGPHFCFGAHFARLAAKIMFEEICERASAIRLIRPGEKLASVWFSGYVDLPIAWS
jgi:cytochrome P450